MSLFGPNLGAPNLGLGGLPVPSTEFDTFIADASRAGNILVEISAYPRNAIPLTFPPMTNLGWVNLGLLYPQGAGPVQPIQLQFQSSDVVFGPDDSMSPNYYAEARMAERVSVSKYFGIRPDTSDAGQVQVNSGIKIKDQDGRIAQYMDDYTVDGRKVRILFGPKSGGRSLYREVVTTFGIDWTRDQNGDATLRVQDLQFRLNKQFQAREFGGTGGIEGDSDLIGRLKPVLLGERYHFEPVLIDRLNQIYMINDGPIQGDVTLYYGGAAASSAGDYTTYSDLALATIPEGEFATANNLGLVRARPAGGITAPITVTAKGDNSGGYSGLLGDLVAQVLLNRANLTSGEFDLGSLAFLNIGEGSYWFDGTTRQTVGEVVKQLAFDAGGRIVADSKIRALELIDPADSAVTAEIRHEEVLREPTLEGRAGKAVNRFQIRWRPNDRVLTDAEIILPAEDAAFKATLKEPYATTTLNTDAVSRHLDIEDQIEIESSLLTSAAVSALGAKLKSFWRRERYLWTFLLPKRALFFQLGQVIKITYPLPQFESGTNALIVDISKLDFEAQTAQIKVLI